MSTSSNRIKAGWGTAAAMTLFLFAFSMEQVMMPIATSAIVDELRTDTGMVQAAIALVSLVAASLYITGGKLGDTNGKKRIFLVGLILYIIGPLSAALAPSVGVLIGGWSVIRAVGMALAIPTSVGLLIASYPDDDQRGQAFAVYGVGAVASALVGPLLMGFMAEALSWRVPFGIVAALIAVAFILASRSVSETEKVAGMKVDWGGTVLTFVAVASVILGSMLGGRYGWWLARRPFEISGAQVNPLGLSPAPWLVALGALFAAILLARATRMEDAGKQPLFSLRLFDNRTFSAAWGMGLLSFVLAGAIPFMVPVFTQQALGFDSLQSALVMVAFSVGSIILGFASGSLIQRMQARTLMQIALVVTGAGLVWLAAVSSVNMTLATFLAPMFVIGAGFGVITSQIPNVQLSTLDPDLQGEGSGLGETGKELGVGLGAAVIASIMFSMAVGGFVDRVARAADIPVTSEQRQQAIVLLEDEAFPEEAAEEIAEVVPNLDALSQAAYVEGFQIAIGALFGILLLALVTASLTPKVETEAITAQETKELVADVASKRL